MSREPTGVNQDTIKIQPYCISQDLRLMGIRNVVLYVQRILNHILQNLEKAIM